MGSDRKRRDSIPKVREAMLVFAFVAFSSPMACAMETSPSLGSLLCLDFLQDAAKVNARSAEERLAEAYQKTLGLVRLEIGEERFAALLEGMLKKGSYYAISDGKSRVSDSIGGFLALFGEIEKSGSVSGGTRVDLIDLRSRIRGVVENFLVQAGKTVERTHEAVKRRAKLNKPLSVLRGHSYSSIRFEVSRDGKVALSWDSGGEPYLWDLRKMKGKRIDLRNAKLLSVDSAKLLPDGEHAIFSAGPEKLLWNLKTETVEWRTSFNRDGLSKFVHLPNGHLGLGEYDGNRIDLLDLKTGSVTDSFHFPGRESISDFGISSDGKVAVVRSFGRAAPSVWQFDPKKTIELKGNGLKSGITQLEVSPDHRYAVTRPPQSDSSLVIPSPASLWDLQTGEFIKRFPEDKADKVAFSPDGRFVIVFESKKVTFHGIEKAETFEVNLPAVPSEFAVSDNGEYAAFGTQTDRLLYWSRATNEVREVESNASIDRISFLPDNRLVCVTDEGHLIKIWSLETLDLR